MSPRRRMLFAGILGLLIVVVTAVTVRVVAGSAERATPPQDRPGTVLLVPGYGGGPGGLTDLAARIRATGRVVTLVRLPGDAMGEIAVQADTLDRYAADALRDGAPSVDVIGHSNGGIVARYWVQQHDGAHKARRVITLGSPHHGADLAAAGAAAAPGLCPPACQQLAPGSRFLRGLRTPVSTPPEWLALWTVDDETVTPPDSARLEGAVSVSVQSICPGERVSHGGMPSDPVVTRMVLASIDAAPLTAPSRSSC